MFCINAIGLDARCLSQDFPCFLAKICTLKVCILDFYNFSLASLQCASQAAKAELVISKISARIKAQERKAPKDTNKNLTKVFTVFEFLTSFFVFFEL